MNKVEVLQVSNGYMVLPMTGGKNVSLGEAVVFNSIDDTTSFLNSNLGSMLETAYYVPETTEGEADVRDRKLPLR